MPWSRIISGIVAIILALGMLTFGGWYFTLGFVIIVYLGLIEYFQLVRSTGTEPAGKTTTLLSIILLLTAALAPQLVDPVFALSGTLICFYLLFQPKIATIADISSSILGLFYGGYLPGYWIRLRVGLESAEVGFNQTLLSQPFASHFPMNYDKSAFWTHLDQLSPALTITLLGFLCIWAADIGAYTFGKFFGRTRLSDISPKKTVEGAVFGIVGSMAVAVAGSQLLHWPAFPVTGLILGLLVGIASLVGDLTESMMKRDAGVKDSGQLIPGHGGILDRADSYVFTAPIVYYFLTLFLPIINR
ncbi:MAG: phosphatidate cytidylyltransferase [Microcoleaceae cyanobacterium]